MKLKKKNNTRYLIPIAIIMGVVPLVLFSKQISIAGILKSYWSKDLDFFSYYKMVVFLLATCCALISFITYSFGEGKLKKTYYYLPIEIYVICIILSTYYAKTSSVALWGFPNRYEGMFVLLSYLLVLVITLNLVETEGDIKFLIITLFLSATIIGLIGILQYFGFDLFTTKLGEKLILSSKLSSKVNGITAKFDYIFSTLYNPNYVGSYMAMIFTLGLTLYILSQKLKSKILLGLFSLLIFANWLGSLSRAGIIGGFVAIILLVILVKEELIKHWKAILVLGIGFTLVFIGMNQVGKNRLVEEFFSFVDETKIATGQKNSNQLKDVIINDNQLILVTDKSKLKIKVITNNKLLFFNEAEKRINYTLNQKNGVIELEDKRYKDYKFKLLEDKQILQFSYNNKEANFRITEHKKDKELWIIGFQNKGYKTGDIEKWGFVGIERLGSGRGYIWSRSLPMLKDTSFIGFGPDTYALYFPQFDSVGKLITFGTTKIIVDKPHNMYLQVGINTGLTSLLALLILFGTYFISS
ncbi:O-antigen ligase family protein [Halanaerocella petrolearia]